jgi:signal transduction histidine kinase
MRAEKPRWAILGREPVVPDHNGGGALHEPFDRRQQPVVVNRPQEKPRKGRRAPKNSGTNPWSPRNWRLRTKMAVVLLVPTLTALALGGLRVQSELANAGSFERTVGQIDAARQITEVIHQLQTERALVVSLVASANVQLTNSAAAQDQFQRTDDAIAVLRSEVEGLDVPDAESRDRYDRSFSQLKQLTALRRLAQGGIYPDLAVFSAYNTVIDPLVQLGREVTTSTGNEAPSRASTAAQTLGQAKEQAAQLDAILHIAAAHNSFLAASVQNLARSVDAGFDAAVADFFAVATADEQQAFSDGYSGAEVDRRQAIKQTALIDPNPTAPLGIDIQQLSETTDAANDKMRAVESGLIDELRGQASALADSAVAAAGRDAAIVLAALIVAFLLMLRIAWSLLSPLRRLRREALEVARVRLPGTVRRILADPNPVEASRNAVEPVPVFTNEEIGEVARSFDAVHEQAVRMATEQAVLRDNVNAIFVNLSRRSQALIERQLAELDKLEQNEQDPDQLSRFFVLDHLATRMRRNSENLLILSGSGLVKRMARPVSVAELVQAALSEIENYTRVKLKSMPDLLVQGRVVNDLVHLVAELLDNATTFSEPATSVTVSSGRLRTGEVAIQISDEGIGMSDDELAEANQRLADPPDFDVTVSRRMGLYVVARLAQRHNIRVRLHGSIDGGTTAIIAIPEELMASLPVSDQSIPGRPLSQTSTGPMFDSGGLTRLNVSDRSMPTTPGVSTPAPGIPAVPPARSAPVQPEPAASLSGEMLFGRPRPSSEAPSQPSGFGAGVRPQAGRAAGDEPTERLPIYEAVLSQWFQVATDQPTPVAGGKPPSGAPEPRADSDTKAGAQNGSTVVEPAAAEQPVAPAPRSSDWYSPADEGWQAVQSRLAAPAPESTTSAGLPKRVPKHHLVPGSAAPQQQTAQQTASQPALIPRSAEKVRARLSDFQSGLRRGRRGGDEQSNGTGDSASNGDGNSDALRTGAGSNSDTGEGDK